MTYLERDSPVHRSELKILPRDNLFLILIAFLPLFAAQFGIGNQVEQFAIIERLLDSAFAKGDFFVDSAAHLGQPRFYYAFFVAGLARMIGLPAAIHGLMILTSYLLGRTTFVAARYFLATSSVGAAAAAAIAVLNGGLSLGHAGYLTFDSYQPANLAIAIALSGVLFLFSRQYLAAILFGVAGIIHPTIGAEIALISYGAVGLVFLIKNRTIVGLAPLSLSFSLFAAIMVTAWVLPNIGIHAPKMPPSEFFEILAHRRAPHHYLGLGFPIQAWINFLFFAAVITVIWARAAGELGTTRELLVLAAMVLIVLAVCALSLWFVDLAHSRIWITAQVFRMVLVVKWVGFLLTGWLIGRWVATPTASRFVLVAVVMLVSADAQAFGMVAALAAYYAIERFKLVGLPALMLALAALALGLLAQYKLGADREGVRLLIACVTATLIYLAPIRQTYALAGAALICLISLGLGFLTRATGPFGIKSLSATYSWADHHDDATDIAWKAAQLSAPGSIWLAPPDMEAFRLVANRGVLVDFTSIPFDDMSMLEWDRRMQLLYGPTTETGFAGLHQMESRHHDRPALDAARSMGASYAVLDIDTPWPGAVLASNKSFKAIRLPDPAVGICESCSLPAPPSATARRR